MRFPSVLGDFIAGKLSGVRVALPGHVVAYNAATQRADVQPDVQDGELDEDEQRQAVTLPVIPDVPVVFSGSGPYRITFPIAVGDRVLLVFSSSSLASWKAGASGPSDPGDDRHHHLDDAVAIPGLYAGSPTEAPTNAMVLHAETLKLGGPDADDPVVRKSDFDAFVDEYIEHNHPAPGGATSPPTTGEAFGTDRPTCSPFVKSK